MTRYGCCKSVRFDRSWGPCKSSPSQAAHYCCAIISYSCIPTSYLSTFSTYTSIHVLHTRAPFSRAGPLAPCRVRGRTSNPSRRATSQVAGSEVKKATCPGQPGLRRYHLTYPFLKGVVTRAKAARRRSNETFTFDPQAAGKQGENGRNRERTALRTGVEWGPLERRSPRSSSEAKHPRPASPLSKDSPYREAGGSSFPRLEGPSSTAPRLGSLGRDAAQ